MSYRLTNSKCYNALDSRISWLACHDPHREVSREADAYDERCAACHVRFNAPSPSGVSTERAAHAPPCKVATKDCINCHMPKYEIRGSHYSFTDHWIRVVKVSRIRAEPLGFVGLSPWPRISDVLPETRGA